jgi:hypothetical protein
MVAEAEVQCQAGRVKSTTARFGPVSAGSHAECPAANTRNCDRSAIGGADAAALQALAGMETAN